MKAEIEIICPDHQSTNVKKNGKKFYENRQNYYCECCSQIIRRIPFCLSEG